MPIFTTLAPFDLDFYRVEHHAIITGSGGGKTQTLQHMIVQDINKEDPPALIIIDSQNQMLRKIERVTALKDRLVILDPQDDEPPALNMFSSPSNRLSSYSRAEREQLEADIIDNYTYIFAATAQELTAKQSSAFSYIIRLMLVIPHATIYTLLDVMEEGTDNRNFKMRDSKFASYIATLDNLTQSYLERQFYNPSNSPTRSQIARRLYGLLRIPAFARMFGAADNKLDLYQAISERKVVLVNTASALLKDASSIFGRYVVSLALTAAMERDLMKGKPEPFYLVLDEASEYMDEKVEKILIQARKYGLGLLFATQFLDQIPAGIRAAAMSNTSIKFANGSTSFSDAQKLSNEMRTTTEFILAQNKNPKGVQWAAHIRGNPRAVSLSVPFGTLETQPRMTDREHNLMRAQNRARYGAHAPVVVTSPPIPDDGPTPDEEF